MKLWRRAGGQGPPKPTGYVGDHADKLHRVRPIAHDDDERPSREDLDYGRTIFTDPVPVPLPRFLRGGRRSRRSR